MRERLENIQETSHNFEYPFSADFLSAEETMLIYGLKGDYWVGRSIWGDGAERG